MILTTWTAMLARKRGRLIADLADLSVADVCREIANLQWEIVIETAQAAYHAPKEDRARALNRLTASDSILDRYAAQLVRQWRGAKRRD